MISILYVDDEPVMLDLGKRFLERSGKLKVDTFLSAEIAVRILTPSRYDAVISDYLMPGMDGLKFLSSVRSIQPDLPFIVYTGQGDENTAIQALNHGADFYLQKRGNPRIQFEEIENFILNIVGREHQKGEIIAEKKATEAALSLLQTTYAYAPFGFAYVDVRYVYIHVNDALAQISSLSRTELLGRTVQDITPHLWSLIRDLFDQVLNTGQPVLNVEICTEIPSGSENKSNWLISLYPVLSKEEEITGFGILLLDISARKQMEEALSRSEDRYRTLAESAQDTIFIIDQDFHLTYINSYGADLVGIRQEELIDRPVSNNQPYLSDLIHQDSVREVLSTGKGSSYDTGIKAPNPRWMEVHLIPLPRIDADQVQILGIARDVTDRKNAETGLLNANRRLNLLSSITRHDIINQLSFLFIDLEDLKDYTSERQESREVFERVNQAVQTIHHQIEFTREYQEIGIGAPVWQNLHDIIRQSEGSLPMGAVRIEEQGTCVEILADSLFEKVIYNLMENAIRYGGTISTITCSVSLLPEPVFIFGDDGTGIEEPEKEKIFSLGFGQHTGFGLFIAREILSITDMTITETGDFGSGARFEIHIPRGFIRIPQ